MSKLYKLYEEGEEKIEEEFCIDKIVREHKRMLIYLKHIQKSFDENTIFEI